MVGGLVVLPRRNFGRICAELWYSGPTWTKNSSYRTVPFLDFWELEWNWNYNQLFWKLMKWIGCWIFGCIPSECFELTQKLLKWGEIIWRFEFVDFLVSWLASEARKILLKMNILCSIFLDKSAYWVGKTSLGKFIGGGGGARAPCAPPVPTPMSKALYPASFPCNGWDLC